MGRYPVISCNFKVRVYSFQTFSQLVYAQQVITGRSWEQMFESFRSFVSRLYETWEDFLMMSLKLPERTYFESIRNKTGTEVDLKLSLYNLSYFINKNFSQKVIVLIDEYDAPDNHAYNYGYVNKVRSL